LESFLLLVFLFMIIFHLIGRKSIFFLVLMFIANMCRCAPPFHERLNIVISLFFSILRREKKARERERVRTIVSAFSIGGKTKVKRQTRTDVELCRTWFVDKTIWQPSQTSNQCEKTTIVYLNMIIMWLCAIHKNLLPTVY